MSRSPLRAACRLTIGALIAALVVQTWLAMGLVVPVMVAGSSMAPTLLGPHRTFRCEVCRHQFPVGLDELPPGERAVCPYCGRRRAVTVADHDGQRLIVNRAAFAWRSPQRWETVVFRSPEMADQLCVKRVVGLPGETVSLVDGDVWIDGRPARKSLAQQQAVRQLVHQLAVDVAVPPASDTSLPVLSRWRWEPASSADGVRWLVYHHAGGGPITDESSCNQRTSYQLHPTRDVMLTFQAQLQGDGQLCLRATDSAGQWLVGWDASQRRVQLRRDAETVEEQPLPPMVPSPHAWTEWTLSLFDRQVLLAIDGQVVMMVPDDTCIAQAPSEDGGNIHHERDEHGPLAIGLRGLHGQIRHLAVWRDVYYTSEKVSGTFLPHVLASPTKPLTDKKVPGTFSWRLGPRKYFVLGDNSAVSDDSRTWLAGPSLDAKLVIGKPLGVR
jgi:signal peptidase I